MTGGSLRDAAGIAAGAPRLWALGLAGFLARGGIVLFSLPILVLPSVVGLVTFVGPDAVTAAGFSPRLVTIAIASCLLLVAGLALGLVIGVVADLALIEEAIDVDRPMDVAAAASDAVNGGGNVTDGGTVTDGDAAVPAVRGDAAGGRLIGRLVLIRIVSLVPFLVAAAIGAARLVDVGYQEVILPSDATTPLVGRVLGDAPEVVMGLAIGWLLTELLGAVAVRLAVIRHRSAIRATAGAVVWVVRHPVVALATTAATVGLSVIVVGPAIVAIGVGWTAVRTVLLDAWPPVVALTTVGVFVAVWLAGLALAGMAAAWRSLAWSLVVLRDHRGAGIPPSDGGTL